MSLTSDQISFYSENGYLVVEDVFGPDRLTRIRSIIDEFREQALQIEKSNSVFDVASGHSRSSPKLRRIKHPTNQHPVFDAMMRDKRLVDIVADLLGPLVRFDHGKLNFKPADGRAKIEWHQDWAFYPHTNDDLLAIGVMIEDCTDENGPLMVVPGSHRGPLYNHHNSDGVFAGGVSEESLEREMERAVTLTAPAGSISIHHVRTLHASGENASDTDRPLLLFSYAASDAFPVFKQPDLAEFDSRVLRGGPVLDARTMDVPIRLPLPRDETADSIYDNQEKMVAA